MGLAPSQLNADCGCGINIGGRGLPYTVWKAEEKEPTRCCLPQVDPLHGKREQEVQDMSIGYDCKVMFRQVKKRIDGMKKESPDANKSGWPIDLPGVGGCEAFTSFYREVTDFDTQIREVCQEKLGSEFTKRILHSRLGDEQWASIDEMHETLHETGGFPRPAGEASWEDEAWARSKLRGASQSAIRQEKRELPKTFKLREEDVIGRIKEPSIESAMKAGRIFIIDYSVLFKDCIRYGRKDEKENKEHKPPRKQAVLCNPIAVFYKGKDAPLMPIAIQLYGECSGEKVPVNPIYTPDDNYWAWTVAKLYFNQVELHYHIAGVMYMQTVMVGSAMQAMVCKCLSIHHPIRQILKPHIKGCLAIGTAWHKLFSQGDTGLLLKFLAFDFNGEVTEGDGTLGSEETHKGGLKEFCKMMYLKYDFNNNSFLHDCTERMDFPNELSEYRYSEDGMKLWSITETYVMETIKKYYTKADDIEEDDELKAWIREMSIRVTRVMELHPARPWEPIVFNITTIIFLCSVLYQVHSSAIYDYYGSVHLYPGDTFVEPPIDKLKDSFTEADVLALQPTKRATLIQMATAYVMQGKHLTDLNIPPPETSFGEYDPANFVDTTMEPLLEKFRQNLNTLKSDIESRSDDYTCMHPGHLKNSFGTF